MMLPHVASRLFGVPLMVDPGKAAAILAGIGGRVVDGGFEISGIDAIAHVAFENGRPSMGRLGDPLGRAYENAGEGRRLLAMDGSVGIIPIEGTLIHKGKFLGSSSGDTSYEGVQAKIMKAQRDPNVKGVVLEVDSHGGEVAGAFDTAQMIAELSAQKPTLAILTDFAHSAGYLMASAARQIVMPETGGAGSIGVITLHADMSQKLEKQGVKVTVISSGAYKADGHPALPMDERVLAETQAAVDNMRDIFAGAVGSYRGDRLNKAAALATEARAYRGEEAVRAGLVDGIMRPSEAYAEFVSSVNRAARAF